MHYGGGLMFELGTTEDRRGTKGEWGGWNDNLQELNGEKKSRERWT